MRTCATARTTPVTPATPFTRTALARAAELAARIFPEPTAPHRAVHAEVRPDEDVLRLTIDEVVTDLPLHSDDEGALAELTAHLTALENLGRAAAQARAALTQHATNEKQARTAQRRAQIRDRYADASARTFGLVDTETGWTLPGDSAEAAVRAALAADVPHAWGEPTTLLALDVTTTGGTPLGQVRVDVDGNVSTHRPFGTRRPETSLIGQDLAKELYDTDPWPTYAAPASTVDVVEHVAALAAHAPALEPWSARMATAFATVQQVTEQHRAEAAEWARLSRAADRIPTATLNKWMAANSHVEYTADGFAMGGWRVVAQTVVGRTRPRHLDRPGKRQRAVGVKEVVYVARIVHESVRRFERDGRGFHTFSDRDIATLEEILPGCEVKVPEDRKALFVAVKDERYREALDAAVVEWVLLGD